jgi:hypothetical protein
LKQKKIFSKAKMNKDFFSNQNLYKKIMEGEEEKLNEFKDEDYMEGFDKYKFTKLYDSDSDEQSYKKEIDFFEIENKTDSQVLLNEGLLNEEEKEKILEIINQMETKDEVLLPLEDEVLLNETSQIENKEEDLFFKNDEDLIKEIEKMEEEKEKIKKMNIKEEEELYYKNEQFQKKFKDFKEITVLLQKKKNNELAKGFLNPL